MKKNILATSIAEAMVVMLVILIGITGSYQMFSQSIKTVDSSEFKIRAISMAKEGIEAVNNVRDTNWILFKGDLPNCWNTLNYNTSCFNNTTTTHDIRPGSYKTYIGSNNRWVLQNYTGTLDYSEAAYRNFFTVGLDNKGFFTQNSADIVEEIKPPFTREIIISYLDDGSGVTNSNSQKMNVTVKIQWTDSSSSTVRKVEMSNILTNWANKKTN